MYDENDIEVLRSRERLREGDEGKQVVESHRYSNSIWSNDICRGHLNKATADDRPADRSCGSTFAARGHEGS
nr:hypothetical protein CFP56_22453 [Quercus suber]